MSNIFKPVITNKGLEVISKLQAVNKPCQITHVALGSGASYIATGQESSLKEEKQRVPISDCQWIENGQNGQIHLKAVADDQHAEPYDIFEVGFIIKGVNGEQVLFALYTTGNATKLVYKSKEADVLLAFDLVLGLSDQEIRLLIPSTKSGEGFSYPVATVEKPGIVSLATAEQVKDGKDSSSVITSATLAPLLEEIKNLQAKFNTRLDSFGQIPVGTIIDWWRPEENERYLFPVGFVICDGRIIDDSQSVYHGKAVPNLIDKFIRAVPINRLGEVGGKSEWNAQQDPTLLTDAIGSHSHNYKDLKSLTGWVVPIANYPKKEDKPWACGVYNSDGKLEDAMFRTRGKNDSTDHNEGQHRHSLPDLNSDGNHTHKIVEGKIATIPPYFGLLKLIRIK
ncbi:hypothetical protein IM40_09565 (plasmid) [Candidatus Paracaedimonas acanthamoebae]|nr:hypothetical protein IM40_09565 [Candidatus Paracaedimonas acanthamoebae]